jgi:hypothetical protein
MLIPGNGKKKTRGPCGSRVNPIQESWRRQTNITAPQQITQLLVWNNSYSKFE